MKTTYLVYKQIDGVQRLVPATRAEWDAIMKENAQWQNNRRDCSANTGTILWTR